MTGRQAGELVGLDRGLHNQFVRVTSIGGVSYSGEVIGVYNEANFFWNPTAHSTITVFTSTNQKASLDSFRSAAVSYSVIYITQNGGYYVTVVMLHFRATTERKSFLTKRIIN